MQARSIIGQPEKAFDHFFGFLGSQTDQYKPDLVEDQAHVRPDGRHLSAQITDKAIFYIDRQKKAAPDKPFFLYYAPGATHAPHQVDKYWSDQYKGKFDQGWDVYREEVLNVRRSSALSLPMRYFPIATRTLRPGINCQRTKKSFMRASWKSMRVI
jgi:arylsulfatase A-like enzyme